jgi:hypothetical protein
MYACCKEFNIPFLCFLQPYALYENNKLAMEEKNKILLNPISKSYCKQAIQFYEHITTVSKGYPYIVDLTGIFDNQTDCFRHGDPIHWNEKGNQMIADAIFRYLMKYDFLKK